MDRRDRSGRDRDRGRTDSDAGAGLRMDSPVRARRRPERLGVESFSESTPSQRLGVDSCRLQRTAGALESESLTRRRDSELLKMIAGSGTG